MCTSHSVEQQIYTYDTMCLVGYTVTTLRKKNSLIFILKVSMTPFLPTMLIIIRSVRFFPLKASKDAQMYPCL